MELCLDFVSSCNIRCTGCSIGRYLHALPRLPRIEYMPLDLCEAILAKAKTIPELYNIKAYGNSEPFLHPQLPQIVGLIERYGFNTTLSTNLCHATDFDALMSHHNIAQILIALSGFTQQVYELGHRGGNVEKVKEHMRQLAAARDRHCNKVDLSVRYLVYRDNQHEAELMHDFARSLNISFTATIAEESPDLMTLTGDDALRAEIYGDLLEGIVAEEQRHAERVLKNTGLMLHNPINYCSIAQHQIFINYRGQVLVCSGGVLAGEKAVVGNFLELPVEEILRRKRGHPYCGRCLAHCGGSLCYLYPIAQQLIAGARNRCQFDGDDNAFLRGFASGTIVSPEQEFPKEISVFGAGATAPIIQKLFAEVYGINIRMFIDDDPHKQGKCIEGIPVLSLGDYAAKNPAHSVLVAMVRGEEIVRKVIERVRHAGIADVFSLVEFGERYPQAIRCFLRAGK